MKQVSEFVKKAQTWFEEMWATNAGKVIITFVGLVVLSNVVSSVFQRDHKIKGYPTNLVWLVPLDLEKYAAEFPGETVYRVVSERQTLRGRYQVYEYKDQEGSAILPDGLNTIGKVFTCDDPKKPSYFKILPTYLKEGFVKVPYSGKFYTNLKPPKDYKVGKNHYGQLPLPDYAGYRKMGVKGPIVQVHAIIFNEKRSDPESDGRSYSVIFRTEDGVYRSKKFEIGTIVSENIKAGENVEVRFKGSIPVFCKLVQMNLDH